MDIEEVREKCAKADLPLKESAKKLVFGKGNPYAEILFIGEAPGKKEDEQGVPFVGAAGTILDKMLHTIGLTLADCYVANILKYRPPQNRDPNDEEIKAHTPWLIEQIKAINPRVVVTLGNFSTKFVLSRFDPLRMKQVMGISKLRGKPVEIEIETLAFTCFPIYHPAATLHNPNLRTDLEEDFQKLSELLDGKRTQKSLGNFQPD